MSKVYILIDYTKIEPPIYAIRGVISRQVVANEYKNISDADPDFLHDYSEFELDDPELLNRIAKEGNKSEDSNNR